MMRYMLDSNAVSFLMRGHPQLTQRIESVSMSSLCISAVTRGELLFGLAKHPQAKLESAVTEFLKRVDTLPWDGAVADRYGSIRADMVRCGNVLAPLDMMIAAHAAATNAILITNDSAFQLAAPDIHIEDWTK